MSRRNRKAFALLILRCRVCGHQLGEYGRDSGADQAWMRDWPRGTFDEEHGRFDWRCECGATPVARQDRLDARIDTLIADEGPRSTAIVAL